MHRVNGLRRTIATIALACTGLGLATAPLRADFVFFDSLSGYNAGLASFGISDAAVTFAGPGTVAGPAMTLTGRVDATNTLVNVTGSGENLTATAGVIRESDAGTLPRATITMTGSGMPLTALSFNLDPNRTTGGTFTLTATDQTGRGGSIVEAGAAGPLFFGVIATRGEVLSRAVLTTAGNSANSISQLRAAVPEPTSLALAGVAFGLVGLARGSRALARRSR